MYKPMKEFLQTTSINGTKRIMPADPSASPRTIQNPTQQQVLQPKSPAPVQPFGPFVMSNPSPGFKFEV